MKNISKIFNIRIFLFTFLIWLNLNISGIQNIYFSGGRTLTIIIIKILHLLFLYAIFSKIYSLYKQRHIPKVKNEIIISLIYFFILMVLLLLVWPGVWADDDITILRNAATYEFTPWQHFFSGLFHILCLQTIPIPSGVMIIQALVSALIVGYCVSNISTLYGKSKKQIIILQIILLIITLFPPLILYILSGFRMGIYSYLELALITKMILLHKEKKKISINDILKISFLTIIISCWRTEAIYYPFLILILYFILGKQVIRRKIAIISFIIIMILNVSIGKINNQLIRKEKNLFIRDNNYSILATMEPLSKIIPICDEYDKEDMEIINKVIDVKFILENPNQTAEYYFWEDGVVKEYSQDEYTNYLKTYLKLLLKYPDVAFKKMWDIFVKSGSGFGENSKQTTKNLVANTQRNTLQIYETGSKAWVKWNSVTSRVDKFKTPINLNLRNKVILFLNGSDSDRNLTIIHNIFWNLFIPFTLILISLIYKLIKRDWYMVFLILVVIARIAIVFATAPAQYFMYYLSAYLCSYVISVIVIMEFITSLMNKKNKKNKNNENNKQLVVCKKRIFKQFLSFLLVSGVGWIIDFSIYILLTHFANLKVSFANILSSIPAITYVFLLSNKKIFKNSNSKLSLKIKYLIYFGYQLILLLCVSLLGEMLYNKLNSILTITFLLKNLKIIIKVLITPITMTMNFIVMKNLVEKL